MKKKATKKKKKAAAKKYFVLQKRTGYYGSNSHYEFVEAFSTEAAALTAITEWATEDGNLGDYIITEKSSTIKVTLKIESLNKKETKVKK